MIFNRGRVLVLLLIVFIISGCRKDDETTTISRIAFGSCAEQRNPQPVLDQVARIKPDLFIYLGDNIYSDTYSMDTLRLNYSLLAARPEFQRLKAAVPIYAVWDDHDFGWNDSGRHYPYKEESKQIFLDFFGTQGDSTIADHAGIYHTAYFGAEGNRVQIIFLDLRTFRDKLIPYNGNRAEDARFNYTLDYSPYTTADSTMMGEQQWKWLEEQLKIPADLRIIASSTQFSITHNGYEAWANFPHEQERMIQVIKRTRANGVLFISGDVHYAEISKLMNTGLYPIYDVTSSGITSTWDFATPNDNRIDGPVMDNNFGLLKIDWQKEDPEITLQIIDAKGQNRITRIIYLSELQLPAP